MDKWIKRWEQIDHLPGVLHFGQCRMNYHPIHLDGILFFIFLWLDSQIWKPPPAIKKKSQWLFESWNFLCFSNFNYQCVKEVKILSPVCKRWLVVWLRSKSEASHRKPTWEGSRNFCPRVVEDAHQLTSSVSISSECLPNVNLAVWSKTKTAWLRVTSLMKLPDETSGYHLFPHPHTIVYRFWLCINTTTRELLPSRAASPRPWSLCQSSTTWAGSTR